MPLTISEQDLSQITESHDELVLGIIMRDGTVRLRISGEGQYTGHLDWIGEDSLEDDEIRRGFSVAVRGGRVLYLCRQSALNHARRGCSEFRLEDIWAEELEALLPLDEEYVREPFSDRL